MLKGKFKNMSRTMLIVGLFTTLIGCQYVTKAYAAGNVTDSKWSYKVGGNKDSIRYTEARKKLDDTSAYIKVSKFTNKKSNDRLYTNLVKSNGSFFSKSWKRVLTGTGEYYIQNYAYEDNNGPGAWVKLIFDSDYRWTYTWEAKGLWSPDSV